MEFKVTDEMGRRREPPYEQIADRIAQEESFLNLKQKRIDGLREAVRPETPDSHLIRSLYMNFRK